MDRFEQMKKNVLSKKDKSSKQSLDKKISGLCEKINSSKNYYTTSSCSGRIVVMIDKDKKQKDLFLRVYHDIISFDKLKKDLIDITKKPEDSVKFKQEPCILHVACRSFEDAKKIYDKAKLAGWKKSGIIASGRKFVAELNSTERLEFPIIDKEKILVDDDFLGIIVKKTNENLERTWGKIEKLEKLI